MAKDLELYLHIPFCIKKCNYCDFLSFSGDQQIQQRYLHALLAEIEQTQLQDEYKVVSVFIGGGTPSVLPGEWIMQILEKTRREFAFDSAAEISIEVNPGTVDDQKLFQYQCAGINRLSMGLQSADENELETLGRIHSFQDFQTSFSAARRAGFLNINVDLMSGIPCQNLKSWIQSLETVASFEPEHISAYRLMVEEGTLFAQISPELPDEETERIMYDRTLDVLRAFGYRQYEISNYAKPGYECRHNIGYWKRTEYLGMGLGASSLYQNKRYTNTRDMNDYIKNCQEPQKLRESIEELNQSAQIEEFIFLGLRLLDGVSGVIFEQSFGKPLELMYGEVIEKLIEQKLLIYENNNLRLTREGIHLSNYVFAQFLLD